MRVRARSRDSDWMRCCVVCTQMLTRASAPRYQTSPPTSGHGPQDADVYDQAADIQRKSQSIDLYTVKNRTARVFVLLS